MNDALLTLILIGAFLFALLAPVPLVLLAWWRWWLSNFECQGKWRESLLRYGLVAGSANIALPYWFFVDSWLLQHDHPEPDIRSICIILSVVLFSLVAAALGQGRPASRILLAIMAFLAMALWVAVAWHLEF